MFDALKVPVENVVEAERWNLETKEFKDGKGTFNILTGKRRY